jgi:hypothetical protein
MWCAPGVLLSLTSSLRRAAPAFLRSSPEYRNES